LHNKFKELYEIELETVINDELKPKKEGISMGETIEMINKHSKGDAIMVSDVGQHQMFTCATPNLILPRVTLLWRSRNNGISPAAIGAKMGMPDREVVAVIGDGGFQMTIQELGTIFKQKCQ
jgi:acetolactate synthase-1/2/3 large subunit